MTEPFFSIITVTKNNAAGLRLTAKSIAVQQDIPFIEWIVIDGASSDNTAEIIAEFGNDRTIFISESDNGIYDAMNKGLDRATGRYVWFMNAGDCFSDAFLLRDAAKEVKYNIAPDFVYGDARENGIVKSSHGADKFAWGMFTHHQAMLYRRLTIGELRFDPSYMISADYAFTLHVLERAKRMHYYNRILCDFASGGLSQINAERGRRENYIIRRDLLGMNPVMNKLIYALNGFTFWAKRSMPTLYRLGRIFSRK